MLGWHYGERPHGWYRRPAQSLDQIHYLGICKKVNNEKVTQNVLPDILMTSCSTSDSSAMFRRPPRRANKLEIGGGLYSEDESLSLVLPLSSSDSWAFPSASNKPDEATLCDVVTA